MKTIKIGGKDVPLTKSGLPNQVYLSKDMKVAVKAYADKKKADKKAMELKELTDLLNKLN
jgi:hypothetical protein